MIRVESRLLVRSLMVASLALAVPEAHAAAPRQGPSGQAASRPHDGRVDRIESVLRRAEPELVAIRHDLHRHPEVAGEEDRTAAIVAERLRAIGLRVQTGVGGHGVVGLLEGGRPGPVVAYRADMDAVRSTAPDPAPFASEIAGVRHICGHDVHTTTALAVAEALAAVRNDIPGSVKFIFQPSEENVRGAAAMIRDGVLDSPRPRAIFAFHSGPLEVGQIAVTEGMGLPGLDRITIQLSGEGDVEAAARAYADAILGVSTVGPPGSAGPTNPDFVYTRARVLADPDDPTRRVVRGSVKASSEENYATAKRRVQTLVAAATPRDVRYELTWDDRVLPDMINDTALLRGALDAIRGIVGDDGLTVGTSASPYFGEDFAFFQREIPGVLFWLGVSNADKGIVGMPHSPDFAADDGAIIVGARVMSAVLLDHLDDEPR